MSNDTDTRIHIHRLELMVRIGVPDEERATAQRLTVSLTLWPISSGADLNDDITSTVNYAAICTEIRKFVRDRRDRLIETLADAIGRHLLEVFEINRIVVEVRKFVLPEVKFVSVTVMRE